MAWADCDPNLCAFEGLAALEVEPKEVGDIFKGIWEVTASLSPSSCRRGTAGAEMENGELWLWIHTLKDTAVATVSSGVAPTTQEQQCHQLPHRPSLLCWQTPAPT